MQDSASSLDSRASIRKASSSQSIREDVKKALDGKGKKLMVRAIKSHSVLHGIYGSGISLQLFREIAS